MNKTQQNVDLLIEALIQEATASGLSPVQYAALTVAGHVSALILTFGEEQAEQIVDLGRIAREAYLAECLAEALPFVQASYEQQ